MWHADDLCEPLVTNPTDLARLLDQVATSHSGPALDADIWSRGRYKPTPTIIEAAQALYRGHDVQELSRSEAGAENLTRTSNCIETLIDDAKAHHKKVICFVTGVPGSGKTLAGLNIANLRMRSAGDEHAVFLSGNGPLVDVLRTALTNDAVEQARARGERFSRAAEERKAAAFIQNIHHFRDEALLSSAPPVGKVVIFDEAQRAWNAVQTSRFMREKRSQLSFSMSEPEFLLSVMDRHEDWCAVVCLVGGGQEINTGEAGIDEWLTSLQRSFTHWDVYGSHQLTHLPTEHLAIKANGALHLATSIRSFRAEKLSDFVGAVVAGNADEARHLIDSLRDYPIVITRDLEQSKEWLRRHRRGTERAGLLASSNALRLKPYGIFVKAKVDPPLWFLATFDDVRSCDALEDAATEFEVQGLELDWTCVAWDANWRRTSNRWVAMAFRGTEWQRVSDPQRQMYIANSYRVLLTRARQGMVIFVPRGDEEDRTRSPEQYDLIFRFLSRCGLSEI